MICGPAAFGQPALSAPCAESTAIFTGSLCGVPCRRTTPYTQVLAATIASKPTSTSLREAITAAGNNSRKLSPHGPVNDTIWLMGATSTCVYARLVNAPCGESVAIK